MSRATVVYLVMLVVLVGGLWGVLAIGATLSAPENLDGRWAAAGGSAVNTWKGLTVEQSGQYFQLAFDDNPAAPTIGVTMVGHPTDGPLTLARGPWHVTIDGTAGQDAVRTFRVDGPTPGTFTGRREARPTTGPSDR